MTDHATVEDVRAMPYFSDLTDAEAGTLANELVVRRYAHREIVLTEGKPAPGLFYVRRGKARIYRVSRDGREQALRLAGPGDTFAEVPVFDDGPAPAWVEALEPLEVVIVPPAAFRRLIEDRPRVALRLLAHFARRIRLMTELIEQMSLQTVQARVARYLYQLAREEGIRNDDGSVVVRRELTQQDLATLVGSVREVVGRTMKALEQDGVIRLERRRVVILDIARLRESV